MMVKPFVRAKTKNAQEKKRQKQQAVSTAEKWEIDKNEVHENKSFEGSKNMPWCGILYPTSPILWASGKSQFLKAV